MVRTSWTAQCNWHHVDAVATGSIAADINTTRNRRRRGARKRQSQCTNCYSLITEKAITIPVSKPRKNDEIRGKRRSRPNVLLREPGCRYARWVVGLLGS